MAKHSANICDHGQDIYKCVGCGAVPQPPKVTGGCSFGSHPGHPSFGMQPPVSDIDAMRAALAAEEARVGEAQGRVAAAKLRPRGGGYIWAT